MTTGKQHSIGARAPAPSAGFGLSAAELEARRAQRLRTVAALRQGRTPLHVIDLAANAVAVAEQGIAAARAASPAPPSACQEGCAWCCHKVVGTAVPEVLRIVEHLRTHLSAEALGRLTDHIIRTDEERRRLHADKWAADRVPCPLLADNRCTVYPVRPLTCRGYNSSDAGRCEKAHTARGRVDVPAHVPTQRMTTLVLDGLRAGLAESKLPGELVELTAALRIALTIPDAGARWLQGEPIFAPAVLP